ncbi:hypothetical protein ACIP5Y_27000 [Nocardia sp. NPDC088792]|uniref:DUF7373 family lipoprotein n=1 Tax=Nocardia sp. NPDC088792 TaxID=3364332 RepID=UPI00380F372A
MRRCNRMLSALAVVVALCASGCVVQGHPAGAYPDPKSLDAGAYGVQPLAAPADGNEGYGGILESARLAEALIDPVEADPALKFPIAADGVMLLSTPAKASMLLAQPARAVLAREGLLAGCAVGGSDTDNPDYTPTVGRARLLSVVILRFPDAAAAQRAAQEIDSVDAAVNPQNVSVPIPQYAAAHAHWRPSVPTLAATISDGVYVVSVLTGHTSTDSTALTGLAQKAFDAQLRRLRDFAPTPADRISALPLDQQGMLARMVPAAPRRWPYPAIVTDMPVGVAEWNAVARSEGVVFGPRAAYLWNLRGKNQPIDLEAVNGMTQLERFTTAAAARQRYTEMTQKIMADSAFHVAGAPSGIADAMCGDHTDRAAGTDAKYDCRVVYGRYIAMMLGQNPKVLAQRAAAEYGLLITMG